MKIKEKPTYEELLKEYNSKVDSSYKEGKSRSSLKSKAKRLYPERFNQGEWEKIQIKYKTYESLFEKFISLSSDEKINSHNIASIRNLYKKIAKERFPNQFIEDDWKRKQRKLYLSSKKVFPKTYEQHVKMYNKLKHQYERRLEIKKHAKYIFPEIFNEKDFIDKRKGTLSYEDYLKQFNKLANGKRGLRDKILRSSIKRRARQFYPEQFKVGDWVRIPRKR
jgi:hypothetical protein